MLIMQDPNTITELLSVTDVTVIGLLLGIIALLIYDRLKLMKSLKEKDDKIYEVINRHQDDLKENTKDLYAMSDKWATLFNELKAILK